MRVLGIDPSLTGTAACLLVGEGKPPFFKRLSPKLSGIERLLWFENEVEDLVAGQAPDVILLEDYAYNAKSKAHQIGELGWAIRRTLHASGVPWTTAAPAARAKFATGKGNAKKALVVSAASARSGHVFNSDDEADAFVLACMGRAYYGQPQPMGQLPQTHLAGLDKVEFPLLERTPAA